MTRTRESWREASDHLPQFHRLVVIVTWSRNGGLLLQVRTSMSVAPPLSRPLWHCRITRAHRTTTVGGSVTATPTMATMASIDMWDIGVRVAIMVRAQSLFADNGFEGLGWETWLVADQVFISRIDDTCAMRNP